MQMRPPSKYHLKDIYQEIDFFDRKIEHYQKFEKFDSESDRAAALQKLVNGREKLVKAAAAMVSQGIEFDPKHLPRSFKQPAAQPREDKMSA
jgi:hypothetical protein